MVFPSLSHLLSWHADCSRPGEESYDYRGLAVSGRKGHMKLARTIEVNAIDAALLMRSLQLKLYSLWLGCRPHRQQRLWFLVVSGGRQRSLSHPDGAQAPWRAGRGSGALALDGVGPRHEVGRISFGVEDGEARQIGALPSLPGTAVGAGRLHLAGHQVSRFPYVGGSKSARHLACPIGGRAGSRRAVSPRSTKSERMKLTVGKHPGSSSCG